ncbi:hypothetical protein IJ425_02805 [bacterium]|nr:hypothetical protein [bacterium]
MLKLLDFKFYKENYIAIFALAISIFFIKIFNLQYIEENTLLENLQLIALLGGFIASIKAKNYKIFFTFLALVLFLMFMREISYGRVFIDETQVHFNKKLCHILVGIYISFGVLFALIKKIWVDIKNIIKNIKFPFWTFLMSFGCVLVQILSEEFLNNTCIEETAEFMLYCLILALILIYSKK